MQRHLWQSPPRPLCPDLGPACFQLLFCEALRCALDLRRGLTGEPTRCPICGIGAVAGYPGPAPRWRRAP